MALMMRSTAGGRGPIFGAEADGARRRRCRDGVVLLLGGRGTAVGLGGEGCVDAGVEVLGAQLELVLRWRDGERRDDLEARHLGFVCWGSEAVVCMLEIW